MTSGETTYLIECMQRCSSATTHTMTFACRPARTFADERSTPKQAAHCARATHHPREHGGCSHKVATYEAVTLATKRRRHHAASWIRFPAAERATRCRWRTGSGDITACLRRASARTGVQAGHGCDMKARVVGGAQACTAAQTARRSIGEDELLRFLPPRPAAILLSVRL